MNDELRKWAEAQLQELLAAENKHLADANACRGGIQITQELLRRLDMARGPQAVPVEEDPGDHRSG